MANDRQRINITATFEIPDGRAAYHHFRNMVETRIKALERDLGPDAVLEYLALEKKETDAIVRD